MRRTAGIEHQPVFQRLDERSEGVLLAAPT
jgi:hypothetical protein